MGSPEETVVLLTGFGPFRKYLINPSWQAAKGLQRLGLGKNVTVYIKELPVSYTRAKEVVADMWETIRPKLAVHMGLCPGSKAIILEQCGKNRSYKERDVCGSCPPNHCCLEGGEETLLSVIDVKTLAKQMKSRGMEVIYSRDAGRYVCDFVYYCSLHMGQGRAAFLHLPTSGPCRTMEELLPRLRLIIQEMLLQLKASSHTLE